jgi:hypothetical protein
VGHQRAIWHSSYYVGEGATAVNPEVPAVVQLQDVVEEHISPAVTPSVGDLLSLSLSVKIGMALSVSAGVAHVLPVDSDVSVVLLLLPDVVADLTELTSVPVPSLSGVAVVLPSVSSVGAMSTHTSPHDWSGPVSLVTVSGPCKISVVTVPLQFEAILSISVVSVRRVGLSPPVSVGVGLECLIDL